MTLPAAFAPALPAIGIILAAMAFVAAVEVAIPLHARNRWNRAHLAPNLSLTAITFATNFFLNAAVVGALLWLEPLELGLLHLFSLPTLAAGAIAVALLDFSFYVAHVAMHRLPGFWRYHRVHHSDPAVDVTTTIRQHPGESLIRYAFLSAAAVLVGASPAAFAVYRTASALNGLLEHANIRLPRWLDQALSLVTTWPGVHKVHHSRVAEQTDSNYGNLFSVWDRLLGTFTPSSRGADVRYGLDGFDDASTQTTAGLLALPWRTARPLTERVAASASNEREAFVR